MRLNTESKILPAIIAVSILVPILVAALFLLPGDRPAVNIDVSSLPFFHALLNGITALLLAAGFLFINKGQWKYHRLCMVTAFALSCVFLISYVIYHYTTGHTPYGGQGIIRYVYFFVLASHIILSVFIVPIVLITLYRGITGDYAKHRQIARWTLPAWLYVAVTGVLVYIFMIPYYS